MDLEANLTHRNESNNRTPRWVKVFGTIAIVLALLFAVLIITGVGGPHGPGRHIPSNYTSGDSLPKSGQ